MRYIAIARVFFEPDNNTPSDMILARTVGGIDTKEYRQRLETKLMKDLEKTYVEDGGAIGVEVKCYSADKLDKDWGLVEEIW